MWIFTPINTRVSHCPAEVAQESQHPGRLEDPVTAPPTAHTSALLVLPALEPPVNGRKYTLFGAWLPPHYIAAVLSRLCVTDFGSFSVLQRYPGCDCHYSHVHSADGPLVHVQPLLL